MAEEVLLVLSTFPTADAARETARRAVDGGLAACANILPAVESIYRWKEKVESASEALVFFKTTIGKYQALEDQIRAHHSSEIPEVISLQLTSGLPDYLNWIAQSCGES